MRLTCIECVPATRFPFRKPNLPREGNTMKRNPRNRTRFQMRPLKIDLTEAEILADLHYGVGSKPRQERATRRQVASR